MNLESMSFDELKKEYRRCIVRGKERYASADEFRETSRVLMDEGSELHNRALLIQQVIMERLMEDDSDE